MRTHLCAITLLIASAALPLTAQRRVPKDLSGVRGFNYQSAETIGHAEFWLQYNPSVTERDLDYAVRLQLNQVRVFVPYAAWERNKEAFEKESPPLCACRACAWHGRDADHAVQVRRMAR